MSVRLGAKILAGISESDLRRADVENGIVVAAKATADASGNNIVNTYATKTALTGYLPVGGTAVKAKADEDGNNIADTYATKASVTNIVNGTTKVGSATKADSATTATSATSATTATTATNSNKLGGNAPSYYATAQSVTNITNGTTVVPKATKATSATSADSASNASKLGGYTVSDFVLLEKAKQCGLFNENLAYVSIDNELSIQDLLNKRQTVFFTNYEDAVNFPSIHGCGIILPALDPCYSYVVYVTANNLCYAQFTNLDDTTGKTIAWKNKFGWQSFLSTTGGSLTGHDLWNASGYSRWYGDGNHTLIASCNTAYDGANCRTINLNNSTLSKIKESLTLHEVKNGTLAGYTVFGEHNKKMGTYTGTGNATSKTIETESIGNACLVWSLKGFAIVTPMGAITMPGTVEGLPGAIFLSGKLSLTTAHEFFNEKDVTYYYQVL